MIRTANQYKEAKDFIDKELELYDYALSEKMTSYEYNLYLQDTQYCFNILYEKLRVLEDLIEYLDYYSKVKIDKVKKDIAEKEARVLDFLATCDSDDICSLFNSGAFNDIFKGYLNAAIKDAELDEEAAARLEGSVRWLFDTKSASEVL